MARRITQDAVRQIALALPEAREHQHRGRPDLRVANKIFATLPEDGRSVNVKTTPTDLDLLVSTAPDTYRDVWDSSWVGVTLAEVTPTDLRRLLVTAWRLAAPKQLQTAHPELADPVSPPTKRRS